MQGRVKCVGSKPSDAPKPAKAAVIDGQGRIPFAKQVKVATPNTAKGTTSSGKSRGMGAALRGGRYTYD